MLVASDSSPLIYLAALGDFSLLRDLFGTIHIPEAVHAEVVLQAAGFPVRTEVERALGEWILVTPVRDRQLVEAALVEQKLHRGEAEAVVLARELPADLLLLDERRAVGHARAHGLAVIRTPMVYAAAKRHGLVPAIRERLDRLRLQGFWLKGADYEAILRQLGEL
jgi:predicted nucleic acid-binding protein